MMNKESTLLPLGSRFKKLRVDNNLSVYDVSKYLHLREQIIYQLEDENSEQLLSDVFYRGYFRSYAKFLHFPETELQHYLDQNEKKDPLAVSQDNASPSAKMADFKKGRNKGKDKWLLVLTMIIFAIVFSFTGKFWWQEHQLNEDQMTSLIEQIEENKIPTSNAKSRIVQTVPQSQVADQTVMNTASAANNVSATNESVGPASSAVAMNTAETTQIQQTASTTSPLSLSFSGDCWVKIFDATTGKVLYQGLKKKGDSLQFDEKILYGIHIGSIATATVLLKGENVDITRYSKNKSTARFTLDAKQ